MIPGAIYGEGYRELGSHCFAYIHATEVGGTHPALIEAMGRGALTLYLDTPENAEVAGGAGLPFTAGKLTEVLERTLAMPEAEREIWRNAGDGTRPHALQLGRGDRRVRETADKARWKIMRSWVEVSLGQIRANYRAVRKVVGAERRRHAGGEGRRLSARRPRKFRGRSKPKARPGWLFRTSRKASRLRRPGIRARILVMADFLPEEREAWKNSI